jgi:hypothetical protein
MCRLLPGRLWEMQILSIQLLERWRRRTILRVLQHSNVRCFILNYKLNGTTINWPDTDKKTQRCRLHPVTGRAILLLRYRLLWASFMESGQHRIRSDASLAHHLHGYSALDCDENCGFDGV